MKSTLVESLKRLYAAGNVTEEKLSELVGKGTITEEDKTYILSDGSGEVEELREFYDSVTEAVGV